MKIVVVPDLPVQSIKAMRAVSEGIASETIAIVEVDGDPAVITSHHPEELLEPKTAVVVIMVGAASDGCRLNDVIQVARIHLGNVDLSVSNYVESIRVSAKDDTIYVAPPANLDGTHRRLVVSDMPLKELISDTKIAEIIQYSE